MLKFWIETSTFAESSMIALEWHALSTQASNAILSSGSSIILLLVWLFFVDCCFWLLLIVDCWLLIVDYGLLLIGQIGVANVPSSLFLLHHENWSKTSILNTWMTSLQPLPFLLSWYQNLPQGYWGFLLSTEEVSVGVKYQQNGRKNALAMS